MSNMTDFAIKEMDIIGLTDEDFENALNLLENLQKNMFEEN